MLLLAAVRYHHGVQNRATGAHDPHRHRTAELGRPAHDLPLGEQDGIHALNVLTPPLLTSIEKAFLFLTALRPVDENGGIGADAVAQKVRKRPFDAIDCVGSSGGKSSVIMD